MLDKKSFRRAISPSASFMKVTALFISIVIAIVFIYMLLTKQLENVVMRQVLIVALGLLFINIVVYLIYNYRLSIKMTNELYNDYSNRGFINREFKINNNNKYLMLLKDGSRDMVQQDYNFVWELFVEYVELNNPKTFTHLTKQVLINKSITSKTMEKYMEDFKLYLERNKKYKARFSADNALRIYPVLNHYTQKNELYIKDIMYQNGNIVYFKY